MSPRPPFSISRVGVDAIHRASAVASRFSALLICSLAWGQTEALPHVEGRAEVLAKLRSQETMTAADQEELLQVDWRWAKASSSSLEQQRLILASDCALLGDTGHTSVYLHRLLARTYIKLDRYTEALDALRMARAACTRPLPAEVRGLRDLPSTLARMEARVNLSIGRMDEALALLMEAEETASRNRALTPQAELELVNLRLDIDAALDRQPRVIALAEEYLSGKKTLRDPLEPGSQARASLLVRLGTAQSNQLRTGLDPRCDPVPALSEVVRGPAVDEGDRFTAHLTLSRVANFRGDYDAARQNIEAAADLARRPVDMARAAAESLNIAMASQGSLGEASERFDDAFERVLSAWGALELRHDGVGFLTFTGRRETVEAGVRLAMAREGTHAAGLDFLMGIDSFSMLARALGVEAMDSVELAGSVLGQDDVLLVYLPTILRSHCFWVTAEGVDHVELGGEQAIRDSRDALAAALLPSPVGLDPASLRERRASITQASTELSEALLPPGLRDVLAGRKNLSIVGMDLLGWIPFEVLEIEGTPLGSSHAIAYAPSPSVLGALALRDRERPPTDGASLAVGSSPDPSLGLTPLPLAESEAREIVARWKNARVLTGTEATYGSTIEASRGLEILQFLCHGFRGSSLGESAGLVLSPGKEGDLSIIYPHHWKDIQSPRVVMATACGSWRGPMRFGDGGAGALASAWFRGGATCVAVSAGDLSYEATVALSKRFHHHASFKVSPAEALRLARVDLAKSERWADPYFHSLVQFVGSGHAPLASTPSPRAAETGLGLGPGPVAAGAGLALLAVLGVVLITTRRRRVAMNP